MHFDEETSNHHYFLLLQVEQFSDCKKQEIAVAKEFEWQNERRAFN